MVTDLLLLLLPVAAMSGWFYGQKKNSPQKRLPSLHNKFPQDYFIGLNFLINEEPDKAVDVFIKMLEVNRDTFETHLALGGLFRRRGEVDRAIRVHQNLIARPELNKEQRTQALFELGQDYLRAGVLDRAERLFLELVDMGGNIAVSLHYLLHIYQQQKDWEQAIHTAQKIALHTQTSMNIPIAHYYCELAEQMRDKKYFEQAKPFLKLALQVHPQCVRASLLIADLEASAGQFKAAIRAYKQIKNQDPDYLSEMIIPLAKCYAELGLESELIEYLQKCLSEFPRISVVLVLSEYLREWQGNKAAIEFLAEQIHLYPSLRGVQYLVKLYVDNSYGDAKDKLFILHQLVTNLLSNKPVYRCVQCGFAAKTLYWQCPQCRHWNTVKPIHGLEGD